MSTRVTYVPDALENYKNERRTLGLAKSTMAGQFGYLDRFGRICADYARETGKRSPLTVDELDKQVIARYFATSTMTQGHLNKMLNSLKGFIDWLADSGELEPGEAKYLLKNRKFRKPQRMPKHYIPAEQFGDMLEAPGLRHPSERMVIAAALYTLGRRGEIGGILFRHIDLNEATIDIYREKRKRWTPVGICPELHDELLRWLKVYGEEYGMGAYELLEAHPDWHLIPRLVREYEHDEKGRMAKVKSISLDPSGYPTHMERIIKRVLTDLGVDTTVQGEHVDHKGEGMHTVRRSGARAMVKYLSEALGKQRAVLEVKTMLDHDDLINTMLYIGMDQEREELNDWLRGNSMYGAPQGRRDGNVIPIRRTA